MSNENIGQGLAPTPSLDHITDPDNMMAPVPLPPSDAAPAAAGHPAPRLDLEAAWRMMEKKGPHYSTCSGMLDHDAECDCGYVAIHRLVLAKAPTPDPVRVALTWTKEKPKVEGWYWRTTITSQDHIHVTEHGGTLYFQEPGECDVDSATDMDAADSIWQWAGPIPEPQESP